MNEAPFMGKSRPKKASPPADMHLMGEVLSSKGFNPIGQVKDNTFGFEDQDGARVYLDTTGWTSFDRAGTETDFGSNAHDLAQYLKTQVPLKLNEQDMEWLKGQRIKAHVYKKAVGLQNQGQPGAVCPNCRLPIKDGEMVTYQAGGMEAHAPGQCPNNPGQETGWQSRLNLPKNYKQPAQHQPGQINPNVGRPTASLLKKGETPRYLDEEWRHILEANGFHPEPGSGRPEDEEIWRSPKGDLRVVIGVDEEDDEPFWAELVEGGDVGTISGDSEELKQLIEPKQEKVETPEWTTDEHGEKVPKFKDDDLDFLKDFRMKGSLLPIKITHHEGKFAGVPPKGFAFAVPMEASGKVAFHLAKAGLDEFETANFPQDRTTMFVFKTEPELNVAEEIVKDEFAAQIAAGKDAWKLWGTKGNFTEMPGESHGYAQASKTASMSPEQAIQQMEALLRNYAAEYGSDPEDYSEDMEAIETLRALIPSEPAAQHPEEGFYRGKQFQPGPKMTKVNSQKFAGQWGDRSFDNDQVHDILDKYREKGSFEQPVPNENLAAALLEDLDHGDAIPGHDDAAGYLGAVVFLVTHGSKVPSLYRERAKQIAVAYAGDADYLQEWKNPQARHAELEREIEILSGGKRASDKVRRAKVLAFASELGFDTGKTAMQWDLGNGWRKEALYDEMTGMVVQHRRFSSQNRKVGFKKKALDANLATFVGTFAASMLVKWLGDEYAKRWGNLAQTATAKAEAALQEKGVYDLGTLDKYAEQQGKNRSGALLSLVGRSLALAVVMTTGIAAQKLFSGEGKQQAQAPAAAVTQQAPVEKTDMWVEPVPEQAPAAKPAPRPSKEQLKQQQKQRDQQVMDQVRQQDKDRNPQNIV